MDVPIALHFTTAASHSPPTHPLQQKHECVCVAPHFAKAAVNKKNGVHLLPKLMLTTWGPPLATAVSNTIESTDTWKPEQLKG